MLAERCLFRGAGEFTARKIPTLVYRLVSTCEGAPVVIFGHGAGILTHQYSGLSAAIAADGYLVALPQEPLWQSWQQDLFRFAEDILITLRAMREHYAAGPFSVVAGHSFGGAAAIVAAGKDLSVSAIVTLAASVSHGTLLDIASRIMIPTMTISAGRDWVIPPKRQAVLHEHIAAINKVLHVIPNASHHGFTETRGPVRVLKRSGAMVFGQRSLTDAEQQSATTTIMLPWIDAVKRQSS